MDSCGAMDQACIQKRAYGVPWSHVQYYIHAALINGLVYLIINRAVNMDIKSTCTSGHEGFCIILLVPTTQALKY